MADRFDLTPVDHDPFEAMGAIPGLMPKPNVLQAGPTSLQGNIAGLGLPAGVLAKYVGEQVDNAYSMATLPGDVALGRTDPNSEEGRSRAFGLAMGLAGGPLASPRGGVRMGFGGKAAPTKSVADMSHAEFESFSPQETVPFKSYLDTYKKLKGLDYTDAQAHIGANWAEQAKTGAVPDFSTIPSSAKNAVVEALELHGFPHSGKIEATPFAAKPFDHSYWGNEVLSAIHDGLPPDQAVAHVKDLAPDSSHAAIDAAVKEYVPYAVDIIKHLSANEITKTLPDHMPSGSAWQNALPGVKKFLGIEEPKPSHDLTPVEHDPFAGTVPPVDMTALYGGLSMDPAARMARARELGFNPDQTLYHGRGSGPFQGLEFRDPTLKSERAIFATDDPRIAESYAGAPSGTHRPEVMPLLARMQNPKVIDWGMRDYHPSYMSRELDTARQEGHDSAIIQGIMDQGSGSPQTQYAIFDPRNLRSKFAAFNPAYKDSANLLSTRGGPFALTPVEHDPWEQR